MVFQEGLLGSGKVDLRGLLDETLYPGSLTVILHCHFFVVYLLGVFCMLISTFLRRYWGRHQTLLNKCLKYFPGWWLKSKLNLAGWFHCLLRAHLMLFHGS